ncbi:MAG: hypothetical protein RLZZ182_1000, partial [Pseudomonadota bacterium]
VTLITAVLFGLIAGVWHWLGPINGKFGLLGAYRTFVEEINQHGGWEIIGAGIVTGLVLAPGARRYWLRRLRELSTMRQVGTLACSGLLVLLIPHPDRLSGVVVMWLFFGLWFALNPLTKVLQQLAAAIAGYGLISYAFTILKASIFLRGVSWDPELMAMDEWLFGQMAHRWVQDWAGQDRAFFQAAETIYLNLFSFMLANAVLCAVMSGREGVAAYGRALVMVYVVGIVGYALFPAWGPFISDAARMAQSPWSEGSWRIVGIQSVIKGNTQAVLNHHLDFGRIPPYAFVAAMPSLHMAIPSLGLFLFRGRPGFQLITLVFCLLTVYSTLLTGMHYGVDLLAGIFIAWIACLGIAVPRIEMTRE